MEVADSSGRDLTADEVNMAATAIETWLTGVRQVLRTVERLPRHVDVIDEPSVPGRARVYRTLVLLYVDSHLVRRLKAIDKMLDIESLSVQDDERAERLRTLHATISDFRSKRRTQRIRNQVTKFIAPYILFVVGPAVILGGVDAEDIQAAFVLTVLLVSFVLYFVFVRFLTVPWGFIPKRALWSGGETVQSIDRHGRATVRRWVGFPTTDLYRAEAAMFDALHVRMAPERPLDISIASDVAFAVIVAAMVAGVVAAVWSGAPIGWSAFFAVVTIAFAIVLVRSIRVDGRLRRGRAAQQRIDQPDRPAVVVF
jgi:hypothetical protein